MINIEKIINQKLIEITNIDPKDLLNENNPTNEDSLGNLIYKLSCVTIQMWENQEDLYKIRRISMEQFCESYQLPELYKIIKRCCDLNYQRSLLTDAIDKKVINGHIR